MNEIKVNGSFVSEKISRIRWLPEQYTVPNNFITGSWDCQINYLKYWKITKNDFNDDDKEYVPYCESKLPFYGDISGLEFLNNNSLALTSTDGYLSLIDIDRNLESVSWKEKHCFKNLHTFSSCESAPCTGLSVFDGHAATVGEDGRVNILHFDDVNCRIKRVYEKADNCSLTCVSFVNHNEVLVGNRIGVVKTFDVRLSADSPTFTLLTSCEDDKKSNCVSCVTYHPTQKHIILTGSEEGSITVWDLRQLNYPASYLSAHTEAITEIAFHRTEPTKLFTASEGGELWQWNHNNIHTLNKNDNISQTGDNETMNPWLNGERAKSQIHVTSLISGIRKSINSFDACSSKIVCGCDNEAVYLIENMY